MITLLRRGTRLAARLALRVGLVLGVVAFLAVGVGPWTGRYQVITVLSGSMSPSYPVGSLILSTPQTVQSTQVGQVMTFQAPVAGAPVVTHRVVELERVDAGIDVRTKGDANEAADPWLAHVDQGPVWRARFAIPHAGELIRLLREPEVHTVTVLVVPAIYALLAVVTIWRPQRKRIPLRPSVARPVPAS